VSRIVQKYGGSSVATPIKLRRVARRIRESIGSGTEVVVVVSAMGDTTDELIALAHRVTGDPPSREMDMLLSSGETITAPLLAMALHAAGTPAISLTGAQAGIRQAVRIAPRASSTSCRSACSMSSSAAMSWWSPAFRGPRRTWT